MSRTEPHVQWNPEIGLAGALPILVFPAIGLFLLLFPHKVVQFQIWMLERQLRRLREKPRLLQIRLLGLAFAAIGVIVFTGLVRAAR